MKRSTSLQSNLSAHTQLSSSSTQRFNDSSSESLHLADFGVVEASDSSDSKGRSRAGGLPLAPVPALAATPEQPSRLLVDPHAAPALSQPIEAVPVSLDLLCEDGVIGRGATGVVRISSCGRVAWKLMTPAAAATSPLPDDAAPSLLHPHLVVRASPAPNPCTPSHLEPNPRRTEKKNLTPPPNPGRTNEPRPAREGITCCRPRDPLSPPCPPLPPAAGPRTTHRVGSALRGSRAVHRGRIV